MIITVCGLQLVGKSTVLEPLFNEYKHYKFPTGKICKTMDINITWEFQVAKDIAMLDIFSKEKDVILLDRGPLSTIFYSLLFKRTSEENIRNYVHSMLKSYSNVWRPIWIKSFGAPLLERKKSDNFDNLQVGLTENDYKEAEIKMWELLSEAEIKAWCITNNFREPISENQRRFSDLIHDIELGIV